MVRLETVRESNKQGKSLEDVIAVFVGGTGGIGESTAKEFFDRTTRPIAYIVGRSVATLSHTRRYHVFQLSPI